MLPIMWLVTPMYREKHLQYLQKEEILEFLLLKAVKEADQKLAETVRLALAKQ